MGIVSEKTQRGASAQNQMIIKTWLQENWGDSINKEIVRLISGVEPLVVRGDTIVDEDNYLVVGSIIHFTDHHSIVWGAGILDEGTDFKNFRPKKVYAVRGPKSREHLLKYGISCPEVYGDPALLFPKFYKPKVEKKYKLGIVPHWSDESVGFVSKMKSSPNVIKIRSDTGIYEYIDLINSCERIASSSLHGIICADAYGVPAIRLWFQRNSEFKFEDYYRSVGRPLKEPLKLTCIDVKRIMESFYSYSVKIDTNKLLESCPFRSK